MQPKNGTRSSSKVAGMDDHSIQKLRFGKDFGAFYVSKVWGPSAILDQIQHTFKRSRHDFCRKNTWGRGDICTLCSIPSPRLQRLKTATDE